MKRTIEVSSEGNHLAQRNQQLVLQQGGTELGRVPLEDLGVLVLDSPHLTLTGGALEGIASHGAVLVACDSDHLPAGVFLPLVAHSTHGERLRHQVAASVPLKKNLWARVVRAKIRAQADVVEARGTRKRLETLAVKVRSGDVGNIEAQAARAYWSTLFDDCSTKDMDRPFRRERAGPPPNNLLNYGYAILRAAMARALCAAGLHPGLGIHHHGRYDPLALASDLMEPFRPWIDSRVLHLARDGHLSIDRVSKQVLLEVLTDTTRCASECGPLLVAMERAATSLANCFKTCADGMSSMQAAHGLLLPEMPPDRPTPGTEPVAPCW